MSETLADAWSTLSAWLEQPMARAGLRAAVILVVGLLVARMIRRRLTRGERAEERLLASRIVSGVIVGISGAWALSELGLSLSVLLGAAGVLTIAVGFAAQTAVSNLISGLFLIVERPFKLEDIIEVEAITGEVVVIDLMSTKLRTYDNLLVRIPNEVLLKANVKNLTHFPIRRVDVELFIGTADDLESFTEIFFDVARDIPLCLDEPRPALLIQGFSESGISIKLTVWATSADFIGVKTEFQRRLTLAMAAGGVDLGVPKRKMIAV